MVCRATHGCAVRLRSGRLCATNNKQKSERRCTRTRQGRTPIKTHYNHGGSITHSAAREAVAPRARSHVGNQATTSQQWHAETYTHWDTSHAPGHHTTRTLTQRATYPTPRTHPPNPPTDPLTHPHTNKQTNKHNLATHCRATTSGTHPAGIVVVVRVGAGRAWAAARLLLLLLLLVGRPFRSSTATGSGSVAL